jgi:hypothetical protein
MIVTFEVLTQAIMKAIVLWDVMPCNMVDILEERIASSGPRRDLCPVDRSRVFIRNIGKRSDHMA